MESMSEKGRINMSAAAAAALREQAPAVKTVSRGKLAVKGKGEIECFFLDASEENKEVTLLQPAVELPDDITLAMI